MLFLPESVLNTKEKLIHDLERGKVDRARTLQQILSLDPDDHIGLGLLANLKMESGDRAGAEQLLWRSVQAQPCAFSAYMQLAKLLSDQEAISNGLSELAFRKMLVDEEGLEIMKKDPPDLPGMDIPEMEDLSPQDKLMAVADCLREQRDAEPSEATERLRPYRLIQQLQNDVPADRALVDALVQEGAAIVPLLLGVLRGWTRAVLADDEISLVEDSIAILGEIGDISAIPYLLELVSVDDCEVSGPCGWALDRIVEQHPAAAAELMREIAPELDADSRVGIFQRLVHNPAIDPNGTLFERLFEKFDRVDKKVRDSCFELMLSTGILLLGRAGIGLARRVLRRHGSLVSRNVRRNCEEMIEEYGSRASSTPTLSPKPSPWTVYQICNGEVDWEEEMADPDDEEEEEKPDFVPAPVRRKATPGRNDPCWCGSGKKYKKCHLEADEQGRREEPAPEPRPGNSKLSGEFDSVRRKVGALIDELPQAESGAAVSELYGSDDFDPETDVILLVDWIVHDRISETFGRTVLEEFLHRSGSQLSERERHFVDVSISTYIDLWEVQSVKEGVGLEVKSLTSGEVLFVHDISLSKTLVRWDGLFSRRIEAERGNEFSGAGVQVPRMHLEAMRAWLEEDKGRTGLSWPVYLKRNRPRIRTQHGKLCQARVDAIQLANSDGDELVISKAIYRVASQGALIASLRSSSEIDESEEGTSFVWLDGPVAEPGHTVLGNIRVVGVELTLECNSRKRLKRGKKVLAELAGTALSFRKEEFTTQEELKREIRANPRPEKSTNKIPPEVERQMVGEYIERHYGQWPDMKLPALDGKTPRQAVKTEVGKQKVVELLKEFENGEERKRKDGEYSYDVSRLRAELGIEA